MTRSYDLYIEPEVFRQRKLLSGNVRQLIKRLIAELASHPRPPRSKILDTNGLDVPKRIELRRIRVDSLRIIYAVNDTEKWVWV